MPDYQKKELLGLTKSQLRDLADQTNVTFSINMTKTMMVQKLLDINSRKSNKKKTLNCPDCDVSITMDQSFNEWLFYKCPDCGCVVDESIPTHLHIKEALHFAKNNALLVIIPLISGYCFEMYPDWQILSGLFFCLSLSILSVAYHEFFHAISAYLLGDFTMYAKGYLRLNIFLYFNSFTSLLLPLGVFVFYGVFLPGAAVYISVKYLRKPLHRTAVSLSGVLANALLLGLIVCILRFEPFEISQTFVPLVQVMAFIQIALIIFNLIPVPGLDGWNAFSPFLPLEVRVFFQKFAFIFIIILVGSIFIFNDASDLLTTVMRYCVESVGLNLDQILIGFEYLKVFDDGSCKVCSFLSEKFFFE
ncbi:site-2 protease family protein [Rhodospirillaceae bacterium]|nr:site-2 protease family protein [Rhodospirillaceae bacterium]